MNGVRSAVGALTFHLAWRLFARFGGHQAVELVIARELVVKGTMELPTLMRPLPASTFGNVGKLKVRNIQVPGQLHSVRGSLVEHDHKLAVGQHGAGRV
jgi:hypothetical protein